MPGFDVVILAGGSGRRLGGVDKGALRVGGQPLLDRVLTASAAAARTVVVGSPRPTVRPVTWTREEPSGGGPVAGLAAGLAALGSAGASLVAVLATDLPRLRADDLDRLLARASEQDLVDAVLFEDAEGCRQPLAGLYRADRLRAGLTGLSESSGSSGRTGLDGASMKRLVGRLSVLTVPDGGATADCDTPEQLRTARLAAGDGPARTSGDPA